MIEVVSAFIVQAGRLLLTQRPGGKDYSFMWETPGGKVEGPHESHHSALRRELEEELGLYVGHIRENALWSGKVECSGARDFFFVLYEAIPAGDPVPREKQGLGWFVADEVRALMLPPGNTMALQTMLAAMRRS